MTTELNTTPDPMADPSGTPVPHDDPKDANAELRAYNKRLKNELKEANRRNMAHDLAVHGLDIDRGLGKAVAKEYEGEISAEALGVYLRDEYGHEPGVATQVPEGVQAGQRLEQALQTSVPVEPVAPPPPGQESINKMESNDPEATRQDALNSIAAKSAQFKETFYS
jgi:hypothetical protein